jgi:tRNA(Ile)-lysidine synthase
LAAANDNNAAAGGASSSADDTPLHDDELVALFFPLASYSTIVLAVSGGADSMALMLLVKRWLETKADAPAVIVASVDHGLRANARAEAEWVLREAQALGFGSALLTWSGGKPATGIQEAARAARYRLLTEFARSAGASPAAIVTAHTEDDQAETLLMRLARGSGIDGLAAMAVERAADASAPEVALVRPLLGVAGARLRATLLAASRTWIDDPSNDAEHFERVRIRKARGELGGLGLSNDKLALSARRLARAKTALDAAADMLGRDTGLDVHAGAFASFDAMTWRAAPEELRLRLVGRLIGSFGGLAEPLRLAQLEALVERMSQPGFEGATLAACIVSKHGAAIHVEREGRRSPLPTLTLAPGDAGLWDHRFRVASAADSPATVEVRALGPEAYAKLRRQLAPEPDLPASAAATLPAFWHRDDLLFVPVIADLPQARALWHNERRLYSAEFMG